MEKAEFVKDTRTPVKFLKGVGEVRSRQLAKLGINTVLDLMEHFPRAYIARKLNPSLRELKPGDNIALTAMISWVDETQDPQGKKLARGGHQRQPCRHRLFLVQLSKKFSGAVQAGRHALGCRKLNRI